MDIPKAVNDIVVQALLEKEREVDGMISHYSALEKKITRESDEDTLEDLRNRRLEQLMALSKKRSEYLAKGYGTYTHINSDRDFFDACKSADTLVAHFTRPTTQRSEYLDLHIMRILSSHFTTKFIKVNVEKTPFICEKFNIWCLPTLMIIKDGKTDHSIIGFDEFGGDGFSTERFIEVLAKYGIKAAEERC